MARSGRGTNDPARIREIFFEAETIRKHFETAHLGRVGIWPGVHHGRLYSNAARRPLLIEGATPTGQFAVRFNRAEDTCMESERDQFYPMHNPSSYITVVKNTLASGSLLIPNGVSGPYGSGIFHLSDWRGVGGGWFRHPQLALQAGHHSVEYWISSGSDGRGVGLPSGDVTVDTDWHVIAQRVRDNEQRISFDGGAEFVSTTVVRSDSGSAPYGPIMPYKKLSLVVGGAFTCNAVQGSPDTPNQRPFEGELAMLHLWPESLPDDRWAEEIARVTEKYIG